MEVFIRYEINIVYFNLYINVILLNFKLLEINYFEILFIFMKWIL